MSASAEWVLKVKLFPELRKVQPPRGTLINYFHRYFIAPGTNKNRRHGSRGNRARFLPFRVFHQSKKLDLRDSQIAIRRDPPAYTRALIYSVCKL